MLPNMNVRNEINHFLINMVENVHFPSFSFPSDHGIIWYENTRMIQ